MSQQKVFRCVANEKWVFKAENKDEAVQRLTEEYEASPLGMFVITEISKDDPDWGEAQ